MSDLTEVFELDGVFYEIKQDKYEPRELYVERVWFILNEIKSGSKLSLEKLITKSRIESNKKYLRCRYN
jgi:hypothetical protein